MIQTKMIQTKGYAAHQAKAPLRQISFERRDTRNHDMPSHLVANVDSCTESLQLSTIIGCLLGEI